MRRLMSFWTRVGDGEHGLEEELHGVGKYGQRDPQETIGAHLEKNSGQDHAPRRGGLGVGVREPGMHWEHRHLDREGGQKGREEPRLLLEPQALSGEGKGLEVQRATGVVERDDADQHQDASGESEEQKLDRGVDAPRTSPDADEEKEGNHHQFPEHEEEKEIGCRKEAEHRRLRDQEHGVELPLPGPDCSPRGADAQDAQERGEEDEWQADAVHTHAVGDVPSRDPLGGFDELQSARGLVEVQVERGRDRQGRHGRGEGDPSRPPLAAQEQD